jgi:hypothetical protein
MEISILTDLTSWSWRAAWSHRASGAVAVSPGLLHRNRRYVIPSGVEGSLVEHPPGSISNTAVGVFAANM